MKKLPYEEIWFTLEDYLKDNTFGKPYLSTVPPKWKKDFSTVTEMYDTIMLDIQHHVNLFFNELFSHVDVKFLPINKLKLIKAACYSTFVSKLYGMLITDKNVKQTFSNNSGYSIEENQTRETNHYQDIFTPSAIKALNQTQIKQLWKIYNTWEEVFAHIKDKNFDYIYTAAEIDELIETIKIDSENLFKNIAAYVEDRLDKYKTELANDEELVNNVSASLVANEELVNKFEEKLETKFTEELRQKQNKLSIGEVPNTSFEKLDTICFKINPERLLTVSNVASSLLTTGNKTVVYAINELVNEIKILNEELKKLPTVTDISNYLNGYITIEIESSDITANGSSFEISTDKFSNVEELYFISGPNRLGTDKGWYDIKYNGPILVSSQGSLNTDSFNGIYSYKSLDHPDYSIGIRNFSINWRREREKIYIQNLNLIPNSDVITHSGSFKFLARLKLNNYVNKK